jgi:hypothetical protein
MIRPELAAAIRDLPENAKLDLLSELWDSLDRSAAIPEWHKEELNRRPSTSEADSLVSWSGAKSRILGSK